MESDPTNTNAACAICLLVLLGGELGVGGCGHVFHLQCLESSLRFRAQCPVCRAPAKRAQKLYFDVGAISKDVLSEWQESKAMDAVRTLEADLKQARSEAGALREELAVAVASNARLSCEVDALTEFKSTSFGKEMQLRRELKSAREELHELSGTLAASAGKVEALEVLADNLRGENKYLRRPSSHPVVATVDKPHRRVDGSAPVLPQQVVLEPVPKRHQPQTNPFQLSKSGKQLTLKPFFNSYPTSVAWGARRAESSTAARAARLGS